MSVVTDPELPDPAPSDPAPSDPAPSDPAPSDLAALRAGFADPPRDAAPMMRWWWFGPAITPAGIERDLTAMADAGLGGAEIAVVYPMSDAGDPRYLSPDFLAALDHAVRFGTSLGLRMDLTLGSGWPFGGPHITPKVAARTLAWDRRPLEAGAHRVPVTTPEPTGEFIAAFVVAGGASEATPLTLVEGHLTVPDGPPGRELLIARCQLTGQAVKRPAAGAEGPVLDHYNPDAVRTHLRAVGDVLLDAVDPALLGSVFCDSLEVYEANWTPALPAEFEARRGYPLLPRLAELVVDAPGSPRLRADMHRTLTELYEENFVTVMCTWAAERGVRFRLQGYGVPPASVSSYLDVDGIEGEGWGWRHLTAAKWASSAAHERGTPMVSAESWTWVHSPSFRATPLDLAGEAHEHLLAGINQFVGHGWPHSPVDAPGIGPIFYASGALDDRNAWWPAAPALWGYLRRLSWLLRQGEPVREVTLFVPGDDVYADLAPEVDLYRATRRHLGDALIAAIRTAGHDYVLVDDKVVDAGERPRPVIVVVGTTDDRAEGWLAAQAAAGSRVVRVGVGHPRAGHPVTSLDLPVPETAIEGGDGDVGAVHRRIRGSSDAEPVHVWFVANTGPEERRITVRPRDAVSTLERWNAHTGAVTARWPGTSAQLTLAPYEAAVLVGVSVPDGDVGSDVGGEPDSVGAGSTGAGSSSGAATITPRGWRVRTTAGDRPVALPHRWEDDPALARFCGTAIYTARCHLDAPLDVPFDAPARRVVLDLGPTVPGEGAFLGDSGLPSFRAAVETPVGAVAEVVVNGRACGVLWAPPFTLDVTDAVRPGDNELVLAVSSTSAHQLADDTHLAATVAAVERRYGRRFVLQDVATADAGVSSGLLGTPILIVR